MNVQYKIMRIIRNIETEGGITLNKKQMQSEQTKKRVADAARSLFALKGYKATSIEDIVAATGSSKGNIYYHFKSKEGLFLYLLDEWDREWEENWEKKQWQYQTMKEKLFGLAEQLALEDQNHPLTRAAEEFFHLEEKTNDVEERIKAIYQNHFQFFETFIQLGIDQGEFKSVNAKYLAIALESLFVGLNQMSRTTSSEDVGKIYQSAVQAFLFGMAKDSD